MKLGCSINLLIPGSTEIEVKVLSSEFKSAQPIGVDKVSDTCSTGHSRVELEESYPGRCLTSLWVTVGGTRAEL